MKIVHEHWLLGQAFLEGLEERAKNFVIDPEAHAMFIERTATPASDTELFIRDGSEAHVPVIGPITAAPDFFMDIFGGGNTTYSQIVAAALQAEEDDGISKIIFEIDSPGGMTAGFLRTANIIAGLSKPTEAQITNIAASAAYGLAVQADRVVAENAMTMVGSVGVVTTRYVSDGKVTITSTEAPDKAPDANTVEGVEVIKRELDSIHVEFVNVIARGRHTEPPAVNAGFGRGALIIAGDALRAGMIDDIDSGTSKAGPDPVQPRDTDANAGDDMTLKELQEKYPALFAEVTASGLSAGVAQERSRVAAHIKLGAAMGAGVAACKHILDGTELSNPEAQADYMIAGRNVADAASRGDDEEIISDLNSNDSKTATGGKDRPDEAKRVADLFAGVRDSLDLGGVE
jgi:ClpP class serine protease